MLNARRLRRMLFMAAVAIAASAPDARAQTPDAPNSCRACHGSLSDARLATPAALFSAGDVHRESRFGCVDCHGGDPTATDKGRAHDAARGFKGAPSGAAQIATCARCHSDPEVMRRFSPRLRVDQAAEYVTSVHGKRLATGDTRIATCASCHGAHGIRRVKDAQSPVFPRNVAATCGACHASPAHMASYRLPDGSPLPTSQLADYQRSVHHAALTTGNDLSAPTCNDCHGNHGATPPGVGSVANVCGTCHAIFAQKFATSVHQEIFDKGCVECHGNHAVAKPSDEMLGTGAHAVCTTCHTGKDEKGALAAAAMHADIGRLKTSLDRSLGLIAGLKNAGIETGGEELALGEARIQLTVARTEVHTSDPGRVAPVIAEGLKIVTGVDAAGERGVAELRYRRRGLALSLGAIFLVVIALALKIRQLDRAAR